MKMWSLHHLPFILCIVLSCETDAAHVIHVSGYEGRDIGVSCPYEEGYESYEKYLCRNNCGDSDVLIKTTEAKKNKFSIYDDTKKQVFTTTISNLTPEDAGKYWCGVTRTGKDYYPAEVELKVVPDSCCDRSTKVQSYEEGSVPISCSYKSEYQDNLKYMCRGNQPSTCLQQEVITSDSRRNGRFRLSDDKVSRKFTVTITSLTQEDSGMYLCGVRSNTGLDEFSAVELEVKEWCCVKSNKLSGIVGRPLTMQCPYPPQHGAKRKFLCKGDLHNSCTEMVGSPNSGQTDVRFTLQDDGSSSSFSVTITELEAGDDGTYWCGSDSQWGAANYTKIQLSVVSPTTSVVPSIRSQSTHIPVELIKDASHFSSVVFIVPAVLLLTLIFALIAVYKYKRSKVRGAAANVNKSEQRAKIKQVDPEEEMGEGDIYQNQDVVARSKQGTSKQHFDETSGDQQDSVYQNFDMTDSVYCNQTYIKAHKK